MTLVGPHRDDWTFMLDGLDARHHSSQGEQRTLALALRLAGHDIVAVQVGTAPVLLLDDVFSELDPERAHRLQEMASGLHQVFIATARPADVAGWVPPETRIWSVRSGMFERRDTI